MAGRASWVPNQHGAWAMVAAPPLLGAVLSGWPRIGLPLTLAWWLGYFAYYNLTRWIASRHRRRGRTNQVPLRNFAIAAGVLALGCVIAAPTLLWWAPVFAPLAAVAVFESWHRRDRGVVNDTVTVLAAGLMTPVVSAAALRVPPWGVPGHLWVLAGLLTLYFWGTVPYVKTNIRQRESTGWLIGSVVFHVLGIACAVLALRGGHVGAGIVVVWTLLAARAAAVPLLRRHHPAVAAIPAKRWALTIGLGEVVATVVVLLALM